MHGNTKSAHPKIRGVQCVRRRLSDGTSKLHFYYRPTGTVLPSPDHPDFPIAYEGAKREFERQRGKPISASDRSQTRCDAQSIRGDIALDVVEDQNPLIYLTPEEVSLRWRRKVDVVTLKNWRSLRIGPPFHRFGRTVLYRSNLLEEWEQKSLVMCD
jgi:hypothetical protein